MEATDLYGDGGGGGHEEESGEGQSEHLESAAEKNALISDAAVVNQGSWLRLWYFVTKPQPGLGCKCQGA